MVVESDIGQIVAKSSILALPAELENTRLEAKKASRESRFSDAYDHNLRLVEQSRALGHLLGEVLGLRFGGVCAYRREWYDKSRGLLENARKRAIDGELHLQQLHIANHLGATLRRLGRLDDSLTVFREALDSVRLPRDLEVKARLLGSLGALYDEIGYEDGADDCYARYEELIELLVSIGDSDDLARLANARALAARSALRRGDLVAAKKKHDEELDFAQKSQDQMRLRAAIFHQAKISLNLGLEALRNHQDPTAYFRDSEEALLAARGMFEKIKDRVRLADSWHHWARLCDARGQWADAYTGWKQAWSLGKETKQLYRQGESTLALARFCQRWALHGESLYWFRLAAQIHCQQYEPLKQSKRIAKLAQVRIADLEAVARGIAEEARNVEREEHEAKEIGDLVKTITGKTMAALCDDKPIKPVHVWQKEMREQSLERWKQLISPEKFTLLYHESQRDLISADVLYHSVVDELPRSALLIAIVAEREMRERIFVPLHRIFERHEGKTSGWARGRPPATVDYLCFKSSSRLRNNAAHGGEGAAKLDRLAVDAMKRRLFLEAPMILNTIMDVDLRGLVPPKPGH